jgi:predicted O-methyltransferase YrrM
MKKIKINRFRDQKNNPLCFFDFFFIIPAIFTYLKFKIYKKLDAPIVNYNAIKIFKILLKYKKLSILEIGSGFSTLWWANQNIESIFSVETNKYWYKKILSKLNNNKVKIIFSIRKKNFEIPKKKFDLCIVDSYDRFEDLKLCLKKIYSHTIVFLDDSDGDSSYLYKKRDTDMRKAENLLRYYSLKNNRHILTCRGFSPSQLYVKESMFSVPKFLFNKINELKRIAV